MARKTRKSSARKKSARGAKKRGSARRGAGKRAGARRSAASKSRRSTKKARSTPKRSRTQATVARAKRVTREVVQQATDAVSAGVETLREVGGNLMDRVRSDLSS